MKMKKIISVLLILATVLSLFSVAAYAEENGIDVFAFTCNGDMYKQSEYGLGEFQIFSLPDFNSYDGCIIVKDTIQNEEVLITVTERIRASKIPVVCIDSRIEGTSHFFVDNREAMRNVVEHFVTVHQVKDFCYLSGPVPDLLYADLRADPL